MAVVLSLVAGLCGAAIGIPLSALAARSLRASRRFHWRERVAASVATGALFLVVASVFGVAWELPAYLYFAGIAVVLGMVDIAEKRLPNAIIYPSLIVMPLLLAGAAALEGEWPALLGAGLGAAALFGVYFVLSLISPAGVGMGDVKLAAVIGLALGYLGWSPILIGSVAGFVIGGLVSVIALLAGKATLQSSIPFGPAMLAGAFLGLLAS